MKDVDTEGVMWKKMILKLMSRTNNYYEWKQVLKLKLPVDLWKNDTLTTKLNTKDFIKHSLMPANDVTLSGQSFSSNDEISKRIGEAAAAYVKKIQSRYVSPHGWMCNEIRLASPPHMAQIVEGLIHLLGGLPLTYNGEITFGYQDVIEGCFTVIRMALRQDNELKDLLDSNPASICSGYFSSRLLLKDIIDNCQDFAANFFYVGDESEGFVESGQLKSLASEFMSGLFTIFCNVRMALIIK